jgi:GT2 family glycosyltransferase
MPEPTVSACIRTRDRLDDLTRLIESIRRSRHPVSEIVVSDDSPTRSARALAWQGSPELVYVEGPGRGRAANGNCVVSRASSDFVLLLDDDLVLHEDCVGTMLACARERDPQLGALSRVIVTSPVVEPDVGLIEPKDLSFLGFQEETYSPDDVVRTIMLGTVLLPRALFDELGFDERLTAVYEEVDLATRAVGRGYEIVICREAVNAHFPTRALGRRYGPELDAGRLYVTLKRYAFTERRPLRALVFLVYAPAHLLGASVKQRGIRGLGYAASALALAARHFAGYTRDLLGSAR